MAEILERQPFVLVYLKWHYGQGLKEFFAVTQNFLKFLADFFSFKLLLKTLVVPWKRLGENYEGGFNLSAWASAFIVNSLMRVVGFVTKILVLFLGFVSCILIFVFAFFIFLIWLLLPIILLGCLVLAATFFIV
jgi:hypothetical protein